MAATAKMTDSARNEAIEERLARVETKTDLLRQDLGEFMVETRSGFQAVQTDMRAMEVRLCTRQDEATTTLRAEFKEATDDIRKELGDTRESLRKELGNTRESLRTEFRETTASLRTEFGDAMDGLQKEARDAPDGLQKEFRSTTDGLQKEFRSTTDGLQTEFRNATDGLSVGLAEIRGYLRGLLIVIVPLSLAVLGLVVNLMRG